MKLIGKLKDDARSYELSEEWDKAIDAYLQVLRLVEEGEGSDLDLPLYNRVGDIYVRLGRPMDAVTYYEQAADRYAEAGLYNNAIALCNKALRYDPARLPLLKKLGSFSASQGFFTDARRWYLEYTEKSVKRGALDDAFAALADLANVTDDAEIRELLARQLRDHGRAPDAVAEFKRAHALRMSAGQHAEADAVHAELMRLDPDVDMSATEPTHPAPASEAAETEQLPGFTDFGYPEFEEPAPREEAAPERFDLADIEFSQAFVDFSAAEIKETEEVVEQEVPADDEDSGPIEVEVEEEHALFALPEFTFETPTNREEPVQPYPDLLDLGADAADESDLDLTVLDLPESFDAQDDEDVPLDLPSFAPEPGSISSFDDSEFGDYGGPPARVFDFSDTEADAEAWHLPVDEQAGEEETPVTEETATDPSDFDARPDDDTMGEVETIFEAQYEDTVEVRSDTGEPELPDVFDVDDDAFFEPAFSTDEEPDFAEGELEPLVEAEATVDEVPPPLSEPVVDLDPVEAALETHQPPSAERVIEPPFEVPVTPPPPVSMPSPARREYVDLAALIDEQDDEEAEVSTRFVVAEIPPTGDEEKDFADMLQQFKQKVAASIPKEDAGSHYDLGIAFKEMGLIDEAIGEFQTALRTGQEKLKVYEELGSCFMLKQQYSVAITVLNRAQQMPFTDETELLGVYYNLGRAHEELGQRAEARTAFEKIVAVDISFQDTTQRLARL